MTDTVTFAPTDAATADEAVAPRVASTEPGPATVEARPRIPIGAVARRGLNIFAAVVIVFVLFGLFLSGLPHARSQVGLQHKFRSQLASNSAPVGGAIPMGAPIADISAKTIGLHEVAVEGSRSSQLREGPGHVVGSPLPGQPGNAVLAGRRTMYGGPFARLGDLRRGDLIRVTTGEGIATYSVVAAARLAVADGSFVQNHGDNRLTLFTSSSTWNANGRLVVWARLRGLPLPPTKLTNTLDADGLGLTGQRDAAPYMLVWLELLAATALFAAYAASRWSNTRVWLVFAPALALAAWLFFESFGRLLPATL